MQKPKFKVAKEVIDAINTVSKWGVLIIGMFCLLYYSNHIGQLPEGISLGEGFAFYLISIGFLIVYALYVAISTCMGSVAAGLIVDAYRKIKKNQPAKRGVTYTKVDTKLMRAGPIIGMAIGGSLGTLAAFSQDAKAAFFFILASLIQGMFVYFLLENRALMDSLSSEIVLDAGGYQNLYQSKDQALDQKRLFQRVLLGMLFLSPLVLAPNKDFIVDAAFHVAQLRKANATIQIKTTWAARLHAAGLESKASFLGSDYLEFQKINVLLRSMGTKVVVELPPTKAGEKNINLPIPSDAIFVE